MSQSDFYQTLGVARTATPAELRAAFVRLSRRHHPDATGSLPWRLQEVQQAYRCLSNPDARAVHDHILAGRERDHFVQQTATLRRLRRYDRRHPRPHPYTRRRWQKLLVAAIGATIVIQVSLTLFG